AAHRDRGELEADEGDALADEEPPVGREAQRAGVERDPSQPLLYPRHVTSPVPGSNSTHGMTRSARFARRPRGGDLLPVPPPYGIARPQAAGRPGRASFIQGTTPTADRRSGPAEPSFSS